MKSRTLIFAGASVALLAATGIAFADAGGPTVVLSSTASSTTNLNSIPITATFSEPVTGFSSGNLVATNAGISAFSGSGATYTFDLNPSTAGSSTTVMIPANSGVNASSTGNQASNTLVFNGSTGTTSTSTSSSTSSLPVISNITVSAIDPTDATVNWTTDSLASTQVIYGTSLFYGASTTKTDLGGVISHSQELFGLTPSTKYDFYVSSSNSAGTATSSNMTFTTAATSTATSTATSSLAISNVTSVQSNGIADNTFTDGWSWDITFSLPVTENAFRIRFSDWGNASNSFPTANNVRIYSPESTNATSSSSAIPETGNSYSGWLYFPNGTNGAHIFVQVKIPFGTANGSYSSNFTAQTFPSTATSTAI